MSTILNTATPQNWRSWQHNKNRAIMRGYILTIFGDKSKIPQLILDRYFILLKEIEDLLFNQANSLDDYNNYNTIKTRLNTIAKDMKSCYFKLSKHEKVIDLDHFINRLNNAIIAYYNEYVRNVPDTSNINTNGSANTITTTSNTATSPTTAPIPSSQDNIPTPIAATNPIVLSTSSDTTLIHNNTTAALATTTTPMDQSDDDFVHAYMTSHQNQSLHTTTTLPTTITDSTGHNVVQSTAVAGQNNNNISMVYSIDDSDDDDDSGEEEEYITRGAPTTSTATTTKTTTTATPTTITPAPIGTANNVETEKGGGEGDGFANGKCYLYTPIITIYMYYLTA